MDTLLYSKNYKRCRDLELFQPLKLSSEYQTTSNEDNNFTMFLFILCCFLSNQSNYIYLYFSLLGWITKNISKWTIRNMLPVYHILLQYTNRNIFIVTGYDKRFITTVCTHYLWCILFIETQYQLKYCVFHIGLICFKLQCNWK
jgi:hypothetical protein